MVCAVRVGMHRRIESRDDTEARKSGTVLRDRRVSNQNAVFSIRESILSKTSFTIHRKLDY
jgi:hypothetical protein